MRIKKVFKSLTATSISWIILGAFGVLAGTFLLYRGRLSYLYPATGMMTVGIGGILCGLTNGFTDQSATGRIMGKFGMLALIIGILVVLYYGYQIF